MVTDGTSWVAGWASGCQPAPGPARGTARTTSVPLLSRPGPGVWVGAWSVDEPGRPPRPRVRGIEVMLASRVGAPWCPGGNTELAASQLYVSCVSGEHMWPLPSCRGQRAAGQPGLQVRAPPLPLQGLCAQRLLLPRRQVRASRLRTGRCRGLELAGADLEGSSHSGRRCGSLCWCLVSAAQWVPELRAPAGFRLLQGCPGRPSSPPAQGGWTHHLQSWRGPQRASQLQTTGL